jgi:O-antigen/teichoic acid export membrane protein
VLVSKGVYSVLFKLGELLKPFLIAPFIIKLFGLESFAEYALILTVVAVCYPIIDAGVLSYSQRVFYGKAQAGLKGISDLVKVQLLMFPLAVLVFSVVFYIMLGNVYVALMCALYLYFTSLTNSFNGFLRARDKFATLVQLKIVADLVETLVIVVFLYSIEEFSLVIFGYLAITKCLYFLCQVQRLYKHKIKFFYLKFNKQEVTLFFRASLILVPIAVIGGLSGNIERFFIDNLLGKEQLGIYVVLLQYVYYLKLVVFPVTFTQLPILSKLYDIDGKQAVKSHISKILAFSAAISAGFAGTFWLLREVIFEGLIGIKLDAYRENTLAIFLVAVCVMNVNSILMLIMTVFKQLRAYLYVNSFTLVFSVILNLMLLEKYGYVFSAFYIFLSSTIVLCFSVFRCKKSLANL